MTWSVADYNTNPDLNVTINGIDIAELCAASGYNNALRQIMGDIAVWTGSLSVTYPIAINKGGTGQITAPLALTALGGLPIAYKEVQQRSISASSDILAADSAGHIYWSGAAGTLTVQPNGTVAIPLNTTVLIVNDGSAAITIARGTAVVMKWAANNTDVNRTLAQGGVCAILKVAADRWFIFGTGLT